MTRTNARALLCLLTLSACSTTSSKALPPELVHAQCPPDAVKIDRSFAVQPPLCVSTFTTPAREGEGNAEVQLSLGRQAKDRQTCLEQVAKWINDERASRPAGAAGA